MSSSLIQDSRKIYSVSEVTNDIQGLLEDNFPSLWLSGEISNFKAATSGHFYFTLKDQRSQISAVMFRGSSHQLKFTLEDGMEVIVHGKISVYAPRGQHQIILDYAEPKGIGALQVAFEQLKKKIENEGLFDSIHKKEIPYLPRKIGIITSSKGAVLHDILNVLKRRFSNMDVLICPVKVQGEGAAEEIAEAIHIMGKREDIDVLIVGRGGGSLEDLWAFNEEVVVRAIFKCPIPLISAVGHETDFTLADLVADLRAPTPSAAAELAVPSKEDLIQLVDQNSLTLKKSLSHNLRILKDKLSFLKRSLRSPKQIIEDIRLKMEGLTLRLVHAETQSLLKIRHSYREIYLSFPSLQNKIKEHKIRLEGYIKQLDTLSPLAPLKRGYGIIFKINNKKPVDSVSEVNIGDNLEVLLSDGKFKVQVIS